MKLPLLVHLIFFPCRCKLLCSVLSIQSEGHSLVLLVEQACWQEILSLFIWECPNLPFILKNSFAGYRIFGWQSFSFSTLNIFSHCLLASMPTKEKFAVNLIERRYPMSKARSSGQEEISHVQGKEQRLRFAGAAIKRHLTSKVRETQVRWQALREGIRGQTDWNHNHRKLANLITRTTALSNSMKLSHAVWSHPKQMGHGGEFWQNVVHWRREWQTTSVFLPWEAHEQYEKAKRWDTERLTPQVSRCPICHWRSVEE